MAGIRCLHSHRRKIRNCYQPDPYVVHLYFFSYRRLSYHYLHGNCVLDEHEKIYKSSQEKSLVLFVGSDHYYFFRSDNYFVPVHDIHSEMNRVILFYGAKNQFIKVRRRKITVSVVRLNGTADKSEHSLAIISRFIKS